MAVFLLALFITGCNYKASDIEKLLPFNEVQVIHKEKLNNGLLVLYIFNAFDNTQKLKVPNVINVAFFNKNKNGNLEFIGDKDWSKYSDENMEVYSDVIHYMEPIYIIYGRINNEDITDVEVGSEGNKYVQAKIIEYNGIRYFYKIGLGYIKARALDKSGNVISQQAGH